MFAFGKKFLTVRDRRRHYKLRNIEIKRVLVLIYIEPYFCGKQSFGRITCIRGGSVIHYPGTKP